MLPEKNTACTPRGPRAGLQRWTIARAAVIAAAVALTGCQRAPAYSLLGSFFPVWLFCAAVGILLAFLVHLLLLRLELDAQIAPPLLVYPAMAAIFSLSLWLVFFS